MAIQLVPRFPVMNPHSAPDRARRELPLPPGSEPRLEEDYRRTLMRGWTTFRPDDCPRHVWIRPERGPWVCDNCPDWRWTL